MKTAYFHNIFYAIRALHYKYGKGDLVDCHIALQTGKITLTALRTSCMPHTVIGSYDGKTLRMYRHQMRVTIV